LDWQQTRPTLESVKCITCPTSVLITETAQTGRGYKLESHTGAAIVPEQDGVYFTLYLAVARNIGISKPAGAPHPLFNTRAPGAFIIRKTDTNDLGSGMG